MTTKAQERKALEQIRKIVEGLGENSYIAMAMEGMFQDAEENIENDFGNSWKQRAKYAQDECNRLIAEVDKAYGKHAEMKKRAEAAENAYNMTQKSADSWCAKYHEAADKATENWNKFREQEDKVEALQNEIIRLKARLFDMMEAQGA